MKKILGTLLAALLFMPWTASAEILSNLKMSGTLDLQANSGRNIGNMHTRSAVNDRVGITNTRVQANLGWDLLDDVHAQVTLRKNDRAWGDTTPHANSQTNALSGNPTGTQSLFTAGTGAANSIWLDRANVTVDKLFGHFDVTVGRQYYGEPGDLVIYFGPKDNFGLYTTSIDGVTLRSECEWAKFTGAVLRAGDNGTIAGAGTDLDVVGFEVGVKNLPLKVQPFVYRMVTHSGASLGGADTSAAANDNLWVYGFKIRGEAAGGWMNLDVTHNSGECRNQVAGSPCAGIGGGGNYSGSALLADLGYNIDVANVGGFTPWLNFGMGTGRSNGTTTGPTSNSEDGFQSIASDYRPGIINRRFGVNSGYALGNLVTAGGAATPVATTGLNNRVVYGFGVNMTPAAAEKLTVGIQAWDFSFQRVTAGNADFATDTAGVLSGSQGNRHIGSEAGITFDWRHSENVKVGFGAATFMPGGFVRELSSRTGGIGAVSPVKLAFADMSIKF